MRRVLEARERAYGPEHRDTLFIRRELTAPRHTEQSAAQQR
jgi:hypothetical protein